jgi:hypothetical protein
MSYNDYRSGYITSRDQLQSECNISAQTAKVQIIEVQRSAPARAANFGASDAFMQTHVQLQPCQ